jgi:chemotaxis methyl-accepting protein methylase
MELLCRLVSRKPHGADLSIAVLACSKGAEVYSIVWSIRRSRPDLKIALQAVDISQEIVDLAKGGVYSLQNPLSLGAKTLGGLTEEEKLVLATNRDQRLDHGESIFQRLTEFEMAEMFNREGDQVRVKPWLREGITWHVGDATSPDLVRVLGSQDVVVANRFLCHMDPSSAESCLRNIAGLLGPGGYLFVSGVDLDVRTKIAKELRLKPVPELMREIHEGDFSLATGWPFEWWGLEPFTEDRADWKTRYASVFEVGEVGGSRLP